MSRLTRMHHEFVEFVPKVLEPGVLYVSMEYATVLHLCCCGCGNEVVTPLAPSRWRLTFNGETISLDPSVGNWSFPCQSHYWIESNQVQWYRRFSQREIDRVREKDLVAMQQGHKPELADGPEENENQPSWIQRLRRLLFG